MPAVVSWVKNILEDKEQWTGSRYFYLLRNVSVLGRRRSENTSISLRTLVVCLPMNIFSVA